MPFLYGNHVVKAHLGRITEDTPEHQGVVIYSMSDVPLVSARQLRSRDPQFTFSSFLRVLVLLLDQRWILANSIPRGLSFSIKRKFLNSRRFLVAHCGLRLQRRWRVSSGRGTFLAAPVGSDDETLTGLQFLGYTLLITVLLSNLLPPIPVHHLLHHLRDALSPYGCVELSGKPRSRLQF